MGSQTYVQSGEKEFVNGVTRAIMECDVSNNHYLLNNAGVLMYIVSSRNQRVGLQVNSKTKVLCVFSKGLIEDFHDKARGTDDLAKQWIKRAIRDVIDHGKDVPRIVYRVF
ncbi:hypothetical protein [Peribacillus loiseleuriae]|uniref:Uncharacterized protein n=1 Tax=Peribacillus loiseleuriae TaxID=1679170 RepID=A0A0K9GXP0_9BACI|nr:hypothetical protein [Peribacillus loiseleuriae]KMY51007.1 hypothetical protein AC625_16935 [Peribacillus loiseleuriae]